MSAMHLAFLYTVLGEAAGRRGTRRLKDAMVDVLDLIQIRSLDNDQAMNTFLNATMNHPFLGPLVDTYVLNYDGEPDILIEITRLELRKQQSTMMA